MRRAGADDEVLADDGGDVGLAEDGVGALVGVVEVDRHVRAARDERPRDRDVQIKGSRRDADADALTRTDAQLVQGVGELLCGLGEFGVRQHVLAVVDGRVVRVRGDARAQDVDECARRGSQIATQQRVAGSGWLWLRSLRLGGNRGLRRRVVGARHAHGFLPSRCGDTSS